MVLIYVIIKVCSYIFNYIKSKFPFFNFRKNSSKNSFFKRAFKKSRTIKNKKKRKKNSRLIKELLIKILTGSTVTLFVKLILFLCVHLKELLA